MKGTMIVRYVIGQFKSASSEKIVGQTRMKELPPAKGTFSENDTIMIRLIQEFSRCFSGCECPVKNASAIFIAEALLLPIFSEEAENLMILR